MSVNQKFSSWDWPIRDPSRISEAWGDLKYLETDHL